LAQDSGESVFGAMQPESTRPKRSLLAKTLCLLALLGAVYSLTTGMPDMVVGAFSAVSFVRPAYTGSRAADVQMGRQYKGTLASRAEAKAETDAQLEQAELMRAKFMTSQAMSPSQRMEAEKQANLAKAAALRDGFKNRNPDAKDLPQWLPFGEKMVGGRDEGKNYGEYRENGQVKDWSGKGWTFWTF